MCHFWLCSQKKLKSIFIPTGFLHGQGTQPGPGPLTRARISGVIGVPLALQEDQNSLDDVVLGKNRGWPCFGGFPDDVLVLHLL